MACGVGEVYIKKRKTRMQRNWMKKDSCTASSPEKMFIYADLPIFLPRENKFPQEIPPLLPPTPPPPQKKGARKT